MAAVFEVHPRELQARSRGSARMAFARQVAMYLARAACGISLTDVGALFGRDRTTVSHACSLVQDKRDDPNLDCGLEHLEQAISCLMDALSLCRVLR
jgi:chromosomal replication initiation ATPase DnaA